MSLQNPHSDYIPLDLRNERDPAGKASEEVFAKSAIRMGPGNHYIGATKYMIGLHTTGKESCPLAGSDDYEHVENNYYYPIKQKTFIPFPRDWNRAGRPICGMNCLDPKEFRPYKKTHTFRDFFEPEDHPKGSKYINKGMLEQPIDDPENSLVKPEYKDRCRRNYLFTMQSDINPPDSTSKEVQYDLNISIYKALEKYFDPTMLTKQYWEKIKKRWIKHPVREMFFDDMLTKHPDAIHPTEQIPLLLSEEFIPKYNNLHGSDLTWIPSKSRVQILDFLLKNHTKLNKEQKALAGHFVRHPVNSDIFQPQMDEFCGKDEQNAQNEWCSCYRNELVKVFGQENKQILSNPACFYPKCSHSGYMNTQMLKLANNCPDTNLCQLNLDVSAIQDSSIVSKIKQQCNFATDSNYDSNKYSGQTQTSQQATETTMQQYLGGSSKSAQNKAGFIAKIEQLIEKIKSMFG